MLIRNFNVGENQLNRSSCRPQSALWATVACLVVGLSGCSPQVDMIEFTDSDVAEIKVDDLSRTMDLVQAEVRFDQREFIDQVTSGLNRWVTYAEADANWTLDPFVEPVMKSFDGLPQADRIAEFKFLNTDAYYLQQCYWMDKLTSRLMDANRLQPFELYRLAADNFKPEPSDQDPVMTTLGKLHPELSGDDLAKLVHTIKLFDWVCRNVQLESDLPLDETEQESRRLNNQDDPAAAGIPGLGYQRYPWQVLMYGRGDYVERAKLVMFGLRLLDIQAVMLATGEDARPWAIAVPIGEQYYLFDTKLALPIPGEKIGTVATLQQLRDKPELLSSLDLTTGESLADDTNYWVRPEDLKQLQALVYVSPEAVSSRMKQVQQSLVGEKRLQVFFPVADVVSQLPDVEGVEAKPWNIAFKTHQYRQAVRTALQKSQGAGNSNLQWYYSTEFYVDGFRPYRTARGRQFLGKFMTEEDARGLSALEGWQRLVYDDATIASLGSDIDLQTRHGIYKQDQDVKEFEALVNSVQGQMKLIRVDAKLFLAQCLYDNSNENSAGSWLEDLRSGADDRWQEGLFYLLGRSYESRKEYDRAIEVYSIESLTQAHGNLIRARQLKQLIDEVYGS
jgi:hypothetical protein